MHHDLAGGVLPHIQDLHVFLREVLDGELLRSNALVVQVEVELLVLEGIVHVGVDVVVQDVLVDAHQHEQFAHRSDQALIAFQVQGSGIGAELLEVADHAQRVVAAGRDEGTDHVPGADLHHEVHVDTLDIGAVILDPLGVAALVPGVLAPLVGLGRIRHAGLAEGLVVAQGVGLVAVVHRVQEGGAFLGHHIHETADGDFPRLRGGVLLTGDSQHPRRILGIVLVAFVAQVLAVGVRDDRDEMDVLPGGSLLDEVLALGFDRTDGGGPDIETLDEFLREFLQGSGARLDVLGLADRHLEGVHVAALDGELALTGVTGVGIGGDLQDDAGARIAADGIDMDPGIGGRDGPGLLGIEGVGHLGAFGIDADGSGRGRDVRHGHAVEVGGEGDVLHRVVDVLGDVVVQEVLVEAGGDEPHAHGADEAGVAFLDELAGVVGAVDLVVADLLEALLTGQEPRGGSRDDVRADGVLVDRLAVVGALIPGILAPDVERVNGRDGLLEAGAVAHRVDEVVALLLQGAGAFLGDHVHDTAQGDTPGLGGSVLLAVDGHREVRLVLGVILVDTVGIGAAGPGNRDEVDVLPGGIVVGAVRTVRGDGADSLLPDVQDADELLGEALQRGGRGKILRLDLGGQGTLALVLGQRTEDRDGGTVGGEGERAGAAAGDDRLVRDRQLARHGGKHPLGNVHEVFGAFGDLGTAGHGDFLLVIAVTLGMVRLLVAKHVDGTFIAGGEVREQLADGVLILGQGQRLATDLERGGNRGVVFPRSVGCRRGIEEIRCTHGRDNVGRNDGVFFLVLAGRERHDRGKRCQGVPK